VIPALSLFMIPNPRKMRNLNMLRKIILLFLLLSAVLFSGAQTDSTLHAPDARLEDGIYITYEDFRRNRGVRSHELVSDAGRSQLEFISKTLSQTQFSYRRNGVLYTQTSDRVWGYSQNNTLYLNYQGSFYRVPVFGAISYMVAQVTVISPGFYDPRFGYPVGNTRTTELREFLMSFYDGYLRDLSPANAKELFKNDKHIYEEYKKLSRRKQKSELYKFIRRYNAANPVYFLNP
jgi:hypothetical protein